MFLLSSHQRTTKTRGDLDIHHGRKLWRHDQKAGRDSAQLATSFRVASIGANPEIYRHLGAPRRRKISTFRRRWRRTGRGPGCWRLKFVTWTSMMRLKKCGTQSVRGRDLTGGRFLSSISTTASRRSVSTSGSTSICGTKPRIRAAKMTAHRQAARRPRQVKTRTRTRHPSSRYKMPGGTSRSRIEHGSAEFHSRVCSADINVPEQMRQLRTTGSLQEKVPDRAGVDRNVEAEGCKEAEGTACAP